MDEFDLNYGVGWYEVLLPVGTTNIVYSQEGGCVYNPEGTTIGRDQLAVLLMEGRAHKLIRIDAVEPWIRKTLELF